MSQNTLQRRDFLASASLGIGSSLAGGVTLLADSKSVTGTPANNRLSIAMVGVGGRGNSLARGFLERDDCHLSYVCDVAANLANQRAGEYAPLQGGKQPKVEQDIRRVLDDKSVDAVVVATPDHWHSLAAVWACQAGKDVYVEKPLSSNPWEGQQCVAAARKHQRIVQVGTQNRSAPYNLAAKQYIESGKLGSVHLCRVFNMKSGGNLQLPPDETAPTDLDWDIWLGPAKQRAYNRAIRYGGWHQFWDYSGGDAANDGIHQLDLARWLIGVELPKSVYCTGGRFADTGDGEVPDTQIATYEFNNLLMTFELTEFTPYMLKTDPGVRNNDLFPGWQQNATRIEIYGTKGMMVVGRHGGGWQVFDRPKSRQPVVAAQHFGRFPDPIHKQNFVDSVRTRTKPNADVLEGHRSALLVHYANISMRQGGEKLAIDKNEKFVDNPDAMQMFARDYRMPWTISVG